MPDFDPNQARRGEMAGLFASEFETEDVWREEELPSLFNHQLQAALADELDDELDDDTTKSCVESPADSDPTPAHRSFAGVLFDPNPPLEILVKVKQFAKRRGEDGELGIPRHMCAVLYLASISAALVHCGERITDVTDEALLAKLRWAANQSWTDDATQSLIQEAIARLG